MINSVSTVDLRLRRWLTSTWGKVPPQFNGVRLSGQIVKRISYNNSCCQLLGVNNLTLSWVLFLKLPGVVLKTSTDHIGRSLLRSDRRGTFGCFMWKIREEIWPQVAVPVKLSLYFKQIGEKLSDTSGHSRVNPNPILKNRKTLINLNFLHFYFF